MQDRVGSSGTRGGWRRWARSAGVARMAPIVLVCASVSAFAAGDETASGKATTSAPPREVAVKIVEHKSGEWTCGLSDEERATLFAIVEDSLRWCVEQNGKGKFAFDRYSLPDRLREMRATFVTLKIKGNLRGCIGSLAPVSELYQSAHDNAVNAALHDFRFRPVTSAELPKLEVHISILSPIEGIPSLDAFKIGEHGIIMEKGRHRAVYLPEVAVEQGWTKDETLSSLSAKAGLTPDAWREGTTFKVFSSVVLEKSTAPEKGSKP